MGNIYSRAGFQKVCGNEWALFFLFPTNKLGSLFVQVVDGSQWNTSSLKQLVFETAIALPLGEDCLGFALFQQAFGLQQEKRFEQLCIAALNGFPYLRHKKTKHASFQLLS